MTPIDRFTLDHSRIQFLTDDEYTEEVFFVEDTHKVSKTNLFSINSSKWEYPVDLREKKIQVRFDRNHKQRFIVYFNEQRMGEASPVNLVYNANLRKAKQGEAERSNQFMQRLKNLLIELI